VTQSVQWTREAGAQPIPGYRLIEPLGQGGFGEVWKCEAPGGLVKAIKFVSGEGIGGPVTQEFDALQRIRTIRHPFILSLDRVEVVDGVLLLVMELADKSLHALQEEYRTQGMPGIPRDELLGYLLEAAEALDWMNFGHGLQHLDVKPHNLFLVSNHVKVGDFGLVHSLGETDEGHSPQRRGGVTPLYASPEILRGTLSRHSDQYSLAIVYQQLLTGTVPFWSQNPYQLMTAHLSAEPNLVALTDEEKPLIARALAKSPEQRFPSCIDFIQALVCGYDATPPMPGASAASPRAPGEPDPLRRPPLRRLPTTPNEEKPTRSLRGLAGSTKDTPDGSASEGEHETPGSAPDTMSPSWLAAPEKGPSGYQPTCVALPGYRFVDWVCQNPLGDVWTVAPSGQDDAIERRALCLHGFVQEDSALVARLEGLKHPALPPAEVSWSPSGRLVLVTDRFERTLRDRFKACQAAGQPGVPRDELLGYLRAAAEALDELHRQHGLSHLGLSPRSLVLQEDRLWLADFGLVPLAWLPSGRSTAQVNGRYAAPEMLERSSAVEPGPAADQYSLAVIYAEMLTGVPPRTPRQGREADAADRHRPGQPLHPSSSARALGGRTSEGALSKVRLSSGRRLPRVDLDMLPGSDREVICKALADDPADRFGSCSELVRALEQVGRTGAAADLYRHLPAVIPFTSLLGEAPAPDTVLPTVGQVIMALTAKGEPKTIVGAPNVRYLVHPGGTWEYQCPVQLFTGGIRLKVDGFRQQWGARLVHETANVFTFHLDLNPPRRFRDRVFGPPPCVEIRLEVQPRRAADSTLSEAKVRLQPLGGMAGPAARLLPEIGPQLFDSIREYLQARPEQRMKDRWPCPRPLCVYPVRPDLELDEVLNGMSRNISHGGVSFRVPRPPTAERVYLHWHRSPCVLAYAILARITRVQPLLGAYEVGAAFSS
jgi:serine/threonine protein kinase